MGQVCEFSVPTKDPTSYDMDYLDKTLTPEPEDYLKAEQDSHSISISGWNYANSEPHTPENLRPLVKTFTAS